MQNISISGGDYHIWLHENNCEYIYDKKEIFIDKNCLLKFDDIKEKYVLYFYNDDNNIYLKIETKLVEREFNMLCDEISILKSRK